jgi:GNAT superfamily N-acetyltransferase
MKRSTGKPKRLTAQITYLEMRERPRHRPPLPTRPPLALLRARNMSLSFYRFLYGEVGRPHHWVLRRRMADADLATIIGAETTRIDVLYVEGCPAGFFEIDSKKAPAEAEIAYFGLIPAYTGMGLGKWFLAAAIDAAWEAMPERVTVHTNTLDHPRALPLYQKMGFDPVGRGEEEVDAWED